MTTTTEYPAYLAPGAEAREHADLNPDLNPEFNDGAEAGADPDAPWGRKADGSPRAKPGRPAGTPDSTPRTRTTQRRVRVAAAPQRRSAPKAKAKQAGPDYRPGIVGILQLVAAPLAVAGIKNPAFAVDAATIHVHAAPLADAMQETAEQVPQFAAVLDKILTVGPYGALLAAVMPLAVQVMANHGVLPPEVSKAMGAQSPEELMAQMQPEDAAA
jgi:hypothetical protein